MNPRLVLFFSISLLFLSPLSQSMPGGIGSAADNGCNCHGGAQSIPNDSLNLSFTGLPAIYTGNTTYELTIELHLYNLENENRNGYRVSAEHGTFTVNDSNSQIMDDGATQTSTGMEQTVWTMYWTAPEPNHNITFRAHAFWGNGGDGSGGDSWVTTSFTTLPIDSDSDGVPDGIDKCPSSNNPSPSDMDKSSEVDSTGCFIDSAGSETNSGSAASGYLGMIVMIGVVVFVVRKVRSPKQEQVFYAQTQPVISPVHRQSVPIPQVSSVPTLQVSSRERQLEHQSRQAQIEAQRLRQELANQAQLTQQLQSEAAQKQMSDAALAQKQHELAIAQQEKQDLEAKLAEAEKNAPIVQHITYNIQDSAISGDITNKINRNDLE